MNAVLVLLIVVAAVLSTITGRRLFPSLGIWATLPAIAFGFGSVMVFSTSLGYGKVTVRLFANILTVVGVLSPLAICMLWCFGFEIGSNSWQHLLASAPVLFAGLAVNRLFRVR
jgi:hypothetical protein